jgi:hypothetical protein
MRDTSTPLASWIGHLLGKPWALLILLWLAITFVLVTVLSRTKAHREVAVALPEKLAIEKARTERAAGGQKIAAKLEVVLTSGAVWTPSSFQLPPITPTTCPLNEIRPFPYRPFRAGSQQYVSLEKRSRPGSPSSQHHDGVESHEMG